MTLDYDPAAQPARMTLDKTSLTFGAVTTGTGFVSQTSAQVVQLTQTEPGTVTWTATSNQPWLQVSPAAGSGSANLSIRVASTGGLPAAGTVAGAISLSFVGASNTPGPIVVDFTLFPDGTSAGPFGSMDTPTDNRTGVTGGVPFTGWALDDVEVQKVTICRAAVTGETAPVDGNCGGNAEIFVGTGVFIEGSRPDVQAAFPAFPRSDIGGWGFMILTNTLPAQGNGTFVFSTYAHDLDGHVTRLGMRTMACDNAHATLPFGSIDTPNQGETISGSSYVNFGWALTQQPKIIPVNGSTISVYVDGTILGSPSYNHPRADIAAIFPGYRNTDGPVGFRMIDTTALSNGLHTIVWTATDSAGLTGGIGSRFFRVANGASALTAAQTTERGTSVRRQNQNLSQRPSANIDAVSLDSAPILGRRGWDLDAELRAFEPGSSGRTVIRSEEVSRVELRLGPGRYEGYLRTSEGLTPLPIGSRFDADTGVFTWAPGVGFVGAYDLVFVRHVGDKAVARRDVRIILQPKGSGSIGPQVVIDTPKSQQNVGQPFVLAGWAADLDAWRGTGIATLHAWAYPLAGGPPVFLGATAYGGARPDVAAVHGEQFGDSGFGLSVQGLPPGHYDLAIFAWSTERADFLPAKVVRTSIR